MKRFLCIVLVLSTILALSACGKNNKERELSDTQATETTQSVEEEKREYYSNYLSNNDFGYDGDVISASVTSDVYTMDVKISEKGMIFTIGNNTFEIQEDGMKSYFHIVTPEVKDGDTISPAVDKWIVATRTDKDDSFTGSDLTGFNTSLIQKDEIKSIDYLRTIQENGKEYDVLKVITLQNTESLDDSSDSKPKELEIKAYVNTKNHKISKMEYIETEVLNEDEEEPQTTTAKVIITMGNEIKFSKPTNVEENTYEDATMAFAFSFLAAVMQASNVNSNS